MSLIENGVNPEALAQVMKELRRETDALKAATGTAQIWPVLSVNYLLYNIIFFKMVKTTFVSRASDGLILCETYDSSSDEQSERLKSQARDLLKKG